MTPPPDPVTDYARSVVAGTTVAGRLVRLAAVRHLRDLEEGPARGLRWDTAAVKRVVEFFGFLLLPAEGKVGGKPFKLEPCQAFIVGSLFGWKSADGARRFRTAYVEQGKGSGKSPLAGAIGIYGLVADGESRAEIYAAATTREQASILFRDAKAMAESSPALKSRLDVNAHNIAFLPTDSFFRPVSSEHRALDGKRPHMALIDELHEHPGPLVVDKMSAGTKSRRQALVFMITNSGYDRTSVCWSKRDYSAKVLEGHLEDDSWFAYVCQLDPCETCRTEGHDQPVDGCPDCDDWRDEKCWPKANPTIDTVLPSKYLRQQVREAVGMPAQENIVKRLNFCIWTQSVTHAIPMDKWDACKRAVDSDALEGRGCFGGIDIGATSDFTAFALLFPHDDGETIDVPVNIAEPDGERRFVERRTYTILPWFWLPERPRKRDPHLSAVIDTWRRQGFVRTTPGDVVDYAQVVEDIVEIQERYGMRMLALDKGYQGAHFAQMLQDRLGEERVKEHGQGLLAMNAPFRELVELVIVGRFHHDGHPVLRWMAANTAAETRGGLMKPSKDESKEKIDGIAAACMALGLAMAEPAEDWYTPGSLLR